jgi:hypothetical protein
MAADKVEARIDALFAGPPDEFVAARDALAKALKAEGEKDAAAEVKALRRPTTAAWAVNQVARTTRTKKDVAALLQVGDRLRDAHEALLDGKGDGAIRDATAERRKLVAKLTKAAVDLLGPSGESQRDAITHTFDAAVADPDAGLAVRAGRLSKELEAPSGFGGELTFAAASASAPASARSREERRAARRAARATGALESVEVRNDPPSPPKPAAPAPRVSAKEAKEAERRRKQLAREAEDRQQEAAQAAREAAAARQEVSRLQDLLVTANAKVKAAESRAQMAQWAAATAHQALRDVETDD